MGLCAGVIGGLAVLLIAFLMPRKHCPNCDYKLPRFRSPQSGKQAMQGGWTCPNCGAKIDRGGNLIGQETGVSKQVPQLDQTPKKTCPKCAEKIQLDTRFCIHCGHEFTESDIQASRQQAEEQVQVARQIAQEKASQIQKEAKEKSRRNWSWVFTILGGLITLGDACLTVTLIIYAFSAEAAKAVQTSGLIAVIAPFVCVVPVLAIGVGLLFFGAKRLRTPPTAEAQMGNEDKEIESKSLSLDNLNPEDKATTSDVIIFGDDNPDKDKLISESQQKIPVSDSILTPNLGKTPKRLPALAILGIILVVLGLGIGLSLFLFAKPSTVPVPPKSTATPKPALTPTSAPSSVTVGDWASSIAFNINDKTNLASLSFTVGENGHQIDSWSLIDLGAGQISIGGSIPITAGTFKIENNNYVGNTKISQTIEGTFVTPDKVKGTYKFSYGSLGTYEGDWEGAPKTKDTSSLPATTIPKSTVAVPKPAQTNAAVTYLSQFQPTTIELGYGTYSVGTFKFSSDDPADDIHYGDPIAFHGIEYPHGIFAHAPSRLVYNLSSNHYSEFSATLGLVEKISCGDGVKFIVLLDAKEIYRSEILFPWSAPVDIQVPMTNGSELTLSVDPGVQGDNRCDWAIWGDPRLR